MHTCFASNGLKDNTEWLHGTHTRAAVASVSDRGQHTAHRVQCTVYGEPQDDASSEPIVNTVPAFLFFEGIRGTEAKAVKEGRGGVHRTSHRACVSPAQLTVYTLIRANM